MRVPQISDRVKEAPAVALRGLLSGVGQLLLITDKLRNKTGASDDAPPPRTPEAAETAEAAAPTAPEAATPEAAAKQEAATETVAPEVPEVSVTAEATEAVVASEPEPAAEPAPAPAKRASRKRDLNKTGNVRLLTKEDTEAEAPSAAAPAPAAEAAAPGGGPAALPNYDELSVASLRARLRNLSAEQVAELASYEKAHAARPEVITMFERRIAKLAAGG